MKIFICTIALAFSFEANAQIAPLVAMLEGNGDDIALQVLSPGDAYEACEIALESPQAHLLAYGDEYARMSDKGRAEVSDYITKLFKIRVLGLIVLNSKAIAKAAKSKDYRILKMAKQELDGDYGTKLMELQRVMQGGWKWFFRKVFSGVESLMMGNAIQKTIDYWDEYYLTNKNHGNALYEITKKMREGSPGQYTFTQTQRTCMGFANDGFPKEFYSLKQALHLGGE